MSHKHKWVSVNTIWPYPPGYGVYCQGCRTIVEYGLTKAAADLLAAEMNDAKTERAKEKSADIGGAR